MVSCGFTFLAPAFLKRILNCDLAWAGPRNCPEMLPPNVTLVPERHLQGWLGPGNETTRRREVIPRRKDKTRDRSHVLQGEKRAGNKEPLGEWFHSL